MTKKRGHHPELNPYARPLTTQYTIMCANMFATIPFMYIITFTIAFDIPWIFYFIFIFGKQMRRFIHGFDSLARDDTIAKAWGMGLTLESKGR